MVQLSILREDLDVNVNIAKPMISVNPNQIWESLVSAVSISAVLKRKKTNWQENFEKKILKKFKIFLGIIPNILEKKPRPDLKKNTFFLF